MYSRVRAFPKPHSPRPVDPRPRSHTDRHGSPQVTNKQQVATSPQQRPTGPGDAVETRDARASSAKEASERKFVRCGSEPCAAGGCASLGLLGGGDGGDDVLELGLERGAANEEAVDVGARREV